MDNHRIIEVFSDETFVKELLEMDSPAQVQAALKQKDIDMTEDEILVLRDEIVRQAQKLADGGELSLEELDEVAGGGALVGGAFVAAVIVLGVAGMVGTIASTVIGAAFKARRW